MERRGLRAHTTLVIHQTSKGLHIVIVGLALNIPWYINSALLLELSK